MLVDVSKKAYQDALTVKEKRHNFAQEVFNIWKNQTYNLNFIQSNCNCWCWVRGTYILQTGPEPAKLKNKNKSTQKNTTIIQAVLLYPPRMALFLSLYTLAASAIDRV